MARTFRSVGAASAALVCAMAASGQTVYLPKRVHAVPNPGDTAYNEPALAVSSQDPKHLIVAWREEGLPTGTGAGATGTGTETGEVAYAISVDGGTTFTDAILEPGECHPEFEIPVTDPMVAASPTTDDLWVGTLVFSFVRSYLNVYHASPLATSVGPPSVLECRINFPDQQPLDKPFLAVGPRYNGADETMFLFFTDFHFQTRLFGRTTSDLSTLTWAPDRVNVRRAGATQNEMGIAIVPAIIPRVTGATVPAGRIVVAWRPPFPTGGTPVTMYSDDGGASWLPPVPTALNVSGPSAAGDPIYDVQDQDVPSSTRIISLNTVPSIAVDPIDPRRVYVAFWGRSDPLTRPADGNVDLYIAQSQDGGATFLPANTLHLTDALLNDVTPAGGRPVDQILPAICVDKFHGVNLLYTAATYFAATDSWTFQPKWARIPLFSTSLSPSQIVRKSLHVPAYPTPILNGGQPAFFAEYQMIASSKCLVYCAYASAHEPGGRMNLYVSKIDLCLADVDSNGAVEGSDVLAFAAAFAAGAPAADVNGDQIVSAPDAILFQQSLSCGCSPPPP